MSLDDVAHHAGVSRRVAERWRTTRELPDPVPLPHAPQLVRFLRTEVDAMIAAWAEQRKKR